MSWSTAPATDITDTTMDNGGYQLSLTKVGEQFAAVRVESQSWDIVFAPKVSNLESGYENSYRVEFIDSCWNSYERPCNQTTLDDF